MLVVCLAAVSAGYGHWTTDLEVSGTVNNAYVDMEFTNCTCSDPPGTIDMGTNKDVAWCHYELVDSEGDGSPDTLLVSVENAYPGYQCLFNITVHNNGSMPVHITDTSLVYNSAPEVLVLEGFWTDGNLLNTELHQCESASGNFWLHLRQEAAYDTEYTFRIQIEASQYNLGQCGPFDLGGTIGFWSNWDSHQTYGAGQIESWLAAIDGDSDWLGPVDIAGMEQALEEASGGTMQQKFLGHYLATRLDGESGRLGLTAPHDVTGCDGENYLGLATPGAASLGEIFAAIESKYGTASPEFEVMKDICDALNNLEI